MPFVAGSGTRLPQASGVTVAKLVAPAPDRFIADQYATCAIILPHPGSSHQTESTATRNSEMISFGNRWPRYGLPDTHSASHSARRPQCDNALARLHRTAETTPSQISMSRKANPYDKAYVSYCTSCEPWKMFFGKRRRSASLTPCALRGGSGPGSSYRHMFLSFTG